jgi:hypothetical protein
MHELAEITLTRNTAFNYLKIIGQLERLIGLRGLETRCCPIGDKPGHRPVIKIILDDGALVQWGFWMLCHRAPNPD